MTRLPALIVLGAVLLATPSSLRAQSGLFMPGDQSRAAARPKLNVDFSGGITTPVQTQLQTQVRSMVAQEPPTVIGSAPIDCAMPVFVGDAAIDPAFARPVPRDKNYTMRVVQAPKCAKK